MGSGWYEDMRSNFRGNDRDSGGSDARPLRIRFITKETELISDAIDRIRLATRDLGWVAEVCPPSPLMKPNWFSRLLHIFLSVERRFFHSKTSRTDARKPTVYDSFETPDAVAFIGCHRSEPDVSGPCDNSPVEIEVLWPGGPSPAWAALAATVAEADHLAFNWKARSNSGQVSGGIVRVRTSRRASETTDAAVAKAVVLCVDVSRKLLAGSRSSSWQSADCESSSTAASPSRLLLLRYLMLFFAREIQTKIRARVVGPREWHLVLRRGSPWQVHAEPERQIPNPSGRFLADPFLASTPKGDFLFVEDYSRQTHAGQISAFWIEADGNIIDLGIVVREHVHLSFPFVFRIGDVWHMSPESSAYSEVRLYRCTSFPLEWHHVATPLTEVSAADPMIFERGGRWWMLVNIDSSGGRDHCTELHVYSSTDPLGPAWEPHPMNPVLADSRCARNAGLLRDGDRVFRAAQVQAFDSYGHRFVLREIVTLSTSEYAERPAELPANLVDAKLRHHISATDRWTVSDQRNY